MSHIKFKHRQFVYDRDGYQCRYCGDLKGPFHIDHVYPTSRGGENVPENMVVACLKCNLEKGDDIGWHPMPLRYFDNNRALEIIKEVIAPYMKYFIWCVVIPYSVIISYIAIGLAEIFKYSVLGICK